MKPTTKAIGNKFAPAIRVEQFNGQFDLWYCPDFILTTEAEALKIAERNATLIMRTAVRALIEGRYKVDK